MARNCPTFSDTHRKITVVENLGNEIDHGESSTVLTDTKYRTAKADGRKLADDAGLYFRVRQDGRKYWRNVKERSLSLGVYPEVSFKEARKRRDVERKSLADDLDPATERQAEKLRRKIAEAHSFEAVATEWYAKRAPDWVPTQAWRLGESSRSL